MDRQANLIQYTGTLNSAPYQKWVPVMLYGETTLAEWSQRVGLDSYHLVHDVFPGDTPEDEAHRRMCRTLVKKGYLAPEHEDGVPPHLRTFSPEERYMPTV